MPDVSGLMDDLEMLQHFRCDIQKITREREDDDAGEWITLHFESGATMQIYARGVVFVAPQG